MPLTEQFAGGQPAKEHLARVRFAKFIAGTNVGHDRRWLALGFDRKRAQIGILGRLYDSRYGRGTIRRLFSPVFDLIHYLWFVLSVDRKTHAHFAKWARVAF